MVYTILLLLGAVMYDLDFAILKTIIYADIFSFPMTPEEIHHFLIYNEPVNFNVIQDKLQSSALLNDKLCTNNIYYALEHREELLSLRTQREAMMLSLSPRMIFFGRVLSYFPFVEMVGITGALAMRNPSSDNDDLDYLIVTRPGRVWLARASIIFLVRLMRLRNIELCPNYVLASDQLVQSRQDLYIAHEIGQILPLSNINLYKKFRDQNPWTFEHLPNANHPLYPLHNHKSSKLGMVFKRGLEIILSSPIGDWLENWEFQRKSLRFEKEAQSPTASAQIDEGHVKGHFNDYGHRVLAAYQAQVDTITTENIDYPLQSVGD